MIMDEQGKQHDIQLEKKLQALETELESLKKEREELTQQLQQFHSYMQIANCTLASISPDGGFTFISSNWAETLGYKPQSIQGQSMIESSVHPDDVQRCKESIEKVFTTGEKQLGIEFRVRHNDGSWRWLSVNSAPVFDLEGKIKSLVAMSWDITDQKETELKLTETNTRFHLLFDTMREAVIIVDNDDMVRFANRSCFELFGFSADELIGFKGNEVIIPPEDRYMIMDKNQARIHGVADEYEIRGLKKSGEIISLRISGAPLRDEAGNVIGSVGVMTDISESKALKEQLLSSQKMEAIGKLAGGIAHDFNNLLNVIIGYSDELKDGLPQDSPHRIGLEEIIKAGERAAGLTRQLLIFSRKQIVNPRIVDVNDVLRNLSKMLTSILGEQIEIQIDLDGSLPAIKIDPGQLELLIVNLAMNSKTAMPKDGKFSIETNTLWVDKKNRQDYPQVIPGRYVNMTISDTGCGMSADILDKIFEPFFTTKGMGSGAGLGLSTVYGIVMQSRGFISVNSEAGKGTCFSILFPASKESVPRTSPNSHEQHFLGKGEHIFVVEDEKALLTYFSKLISNIGYKVSAYSDSMEALEQVKTGQKPDLIITDVVMPKLNGKQLADKVKEVNPQQKLLFMSGYVDDAIVRNDICEMGLPFIQKPFNSKDIAVQIRHLLDAYVPSQHNAKIMLLDDEEGIRHLFERACLKRGHSVTGAGTLSEALAALTEQRYDILLIDMHLGDMDGVQALTKIRAEKIETPAIVFSGIVKPEYKEALKHLGVIRIVEKSFDNTPILKFIEEFISGSKKH